MTCDRCHERIEPGEGYDTMAPDSASGAAPNVIRHLRPCEPAPRQTAPYPTPIRRR